LPPAWIGVGGVDLFAAEDITYARRLTLAEVPTELLVMPGGFHGFDRVAAETGMAREFTQSKLSALRRAFSNVQNGR
jgi:acetyl esterase/lipase